MASNASIRNSMLISVAACLAVATPLWGQAAAETDPAPMTMTLHGEAKGAGGTFITHGPMVGRLEQDSMTVWVRTNRPVSEEAGLRVFYGTDPDNLVRSTAAVSSHLADDNIALIRLEGLEPGQRYYYAAGFGDIVHQPDHSGSFTTMPAAEDFANSQYNPLGKFNFSFAVNGCARMLPYSSAGLDPQQVMFDNHHDRVLFALHAGDYVYEEGRNAQVEEWLWRMGAHTATTPLPSNVAAARPLIGAWENYKIYLSRNNGLARWHRHVPQYATFDDHEIINNFYGGTVPGLVSRRAVYRDIGLEAWDDYLGWSNPVAERLETRFGTAQMTAGSDILFDPAANFTSLDLERQNILHVHWNRPDDGVPSESAWRRGPGDPNSRVYGIERVIDPNRLQLSHAAVADTQASPYSVGRENWSKFRVGNVEVFVLDTRGNRAVPSDTFDMGEYRTMLGARQLEWLKRSMAESDAEILVLLSSVSLTIPHSGSDDEAPEGTRSDESWTGFMQEREQLIDFWDNLEQPVLVFGADLHNSLSAQVTDNIWEFVASPINADNQHKLSQEGGRPINGTYTSGPREVDIRWSTFSTEETPRENLRQPVYAIVSVNNVFNNPRIGSEDFWVAYPNPQVVVQFYSGIDGSLLYAESVVARRDGQSN